jgi:hypothetical protein
MIDFIQARRLDICQIECPGHRSDKDVSVLAGSPTQVQMAESQNAAGAHIAKF